jgi:hypothetical protein
MTAEVLVFPDAAEVAIVYLRAQLIARGETASVGSVVPKERGRFVTVHKTHGARRQIVIEDSTLVVSCWAATSEAATDLAQLCRGLLGAMQNSVQGAATVYTVTDVDLTDERDVLSDQPLSSFALKIAMRGYAA